MVLMSCLMRFWIYAILHVWWFADFLVNNGSIKRFNNFLCKYISCRASNEPKYEISTDGFDQNHQFSANEIRFISNFITRKIFVVELMYNWYNQEKYEQDF